MEQGNADSIHKDVEYRELYSEMRRYRDYELNSSKWYTAMLLAILGYVLKDKMFVTTQPSSQAPVTFKCGFVVLVLFVTVFIIVASVHGVWFAHKRYEEVRKHANKLEREGDQFEPSRIVPSPRLFIYLVQIILGAAIFAAMLLFK